MAGSRLRQITDPDTGEKLQVETTRQAKRRHQRTSGAQWQPTKGQINAAEIWNKQEEKIKRDRDREVKRKKNAARQAEKEAAARVRQDERLRKGEISVEDTWGKVSASQVRLNRFFDPPKHHASNTEQSTLKTLNNKQSETTSRRSGIESDRSHTLGNSDSIARLETGSSPSCDGTNATQRIPHTSSLTNPPHLSPRVSFLTTSPRRHSIAGQKRKLTDPVPSRPVPPGAKPVMRSPPSPLEICNPPSSSMMPPPRRQNTKTVRKTIPPFAGSPSDVPVNLRSPLSEMSPSQLNIRVREKPDPDASFRRALSQCSGSQCVPVSTQVVMDTLAGLSSQDFADDLAGIEKENESPLRISSHDKKAEVPHCVTSPPLEVPADVETGLLRNASPAHGHIQTILNSDSIYDFDDAEIDDETLLELASTQRLKQDTLKPTAIRSHNANQGSEIAEDETATLGTRNGSSVLSTSFNSFATASFDERDLLECVQEFEACEQALEACEQTILDDDLVSFVETFERASGHETRKTEPQKQRRVFPVSWKRTPIALLGVDDEDALEADSELNISPVPALMRVQTTQKSVINEGRDVEDHYLKTMPMHVERSAGMTYEFLHEIPGLGLEMVFSGNAYLGRFLSEGTLAELQ